MEVLPKNIVVITISDRIRFEHFRNKFTLILTQIVTADVSCETSKIEDEAFCIENFEKEWT